jgi:hypothetical protein
MRLGTWSPRPNACAAELRTLRMRLMLSAALCMLCLAGATIDIYAFGHLEPAAKRLRSRDTKAACEATLSRCAALCTLCLAGARFV